MLKTLLMLLLAFTFTDCKSSKKSKLQLPVSFALIGMNSTKVNAVSTPTVSVPQGIDPNAAQVGDSKIPVPTSIQEEWIPISKSIEIGPENRTVQFENGKYAEIVFKYDSSTLESAGLIEEFNVFFYDVIAKQWKPVDMVNADTEAKTITAYTSHFTTFIATASNGRSGRATHLLHVSMQLIQME